MTLRLIAFAALLTPAPLLAQDLTPAETAKIDTLVRSTLAYTGVPSA